MTRRTIFAASVLIVGALAAPVFAQGNSQSKGNKGGNGHASTPPSRNVLAAPVEILPAGGASPFAWIDDATVLEPGAGSVGFAVAHFEGADLSENDFPIVEGALGIASRVQLAVTVPRVVGGADAAVSAGVGTTFVAAKIAVFDDAKRRVKVAVTPTLEILGAGVAESLSETESRTKFGLPVSAELDRGPLRMYVAGGFFTSGVRFAGGGAAIQASPRAIVSLGFSHSWRNDDVDAALAGAVRSDVSGGIGYILLPRVVVFGSVGRTIATLDENGAGTTLSGGISLSFAAPTR